MLHLGRAGNGYVVEASKIAGTVDSTSEVEAGDVEAAVLYPAVGGCRCECLGDDLSWCVWEGWCGWVGSAVSESDWLVLEMAFFQSIRCIGKGCMSKPYCTRG
jgi:hypothetical protein